MLTMQQKIDEIYEYIEKKKKQEKRELIFKWFLRLIFIGYLIYAFFVLVPQYMEKYKGPIEKFKKIINSQNLDKIEKTQDNLSKKIKEYLKKKKQKQIDLEDSNF